MSAPETGDLAVDRGWTASPGRWLLRPAPAVAALVVAVNAFALQPYWPGIISGILGDLGTCFLFPLLLVASWEWLAWLVALATGRPWRPSSRRVHLALCLLAATYYTLLELSVDFGTLHAAVMSWLTGGRRVTVTRDLADLLALPLVALAWVWLRGAALTPSARAADGVVPPVIPG